MSLKTMVVDDHEAARIGLAQLLDSSIIDVVEMANTGDAALEFLSSRSIDIVLIDVQMEKMDGLNLLAAIRKDYPELPVVFISAYDYPVYMARAVANGAQDYVLKSDTPTRIAETLTHVFHNSTSLPGGRMDRIRTKMTQTMRPGELPPELPITPREAQVLRHVAFGLSNREIAQSLKISVETVKEHVQNILRKTGASDRTDVAVRAVRLGLVD